MGKSKGEWISQLVESHKPEIQGLESEIVDAYRAKIEALKDKMIDKLKAQLENKGFVIYVQWIKRYEFFYDLTDFSLNEYFLAKREDIWYFIRVRKGQIEFNGKMFKKFETIDIDKISKNINERILENIGYSYNKDNNQLKLINKDSCRRNYIYRTHRHRDFSRLYKLDKLLYK